MKNIFKISKLLERYRAVEIYHKDKEESLTAKISSALAQERKAQSEKSSAEIKLQQERNELSQHEGDLRSAKKSYDEADQKRKENNAGTITSSIVAGVAGLATILTLGAAAPLTVPVAAGAVVGAVAFDKAADKAKDDMHRSEGRIQHTNSKICSTQSAIASFSSTISQLNRDIEHYKEQRRYLHNEKEKIKKMIMFLIDAQEYGEEYTSVMDHCSRRTDLVRNLVEKAEKKSYSLFDGRGIERVMSSFEQAWDAFEEMNESGGSYAFKVEFQCSHCNCPSNEFPHVSQGQLICTNCSSSL